MYPEPPPVEPTPDDLADLDYLVRLFTALGDLVQGTIVSRPLVGTSRSPYAADFAPQTLHERSLLSFGLPGALGLLQGIRGNARALTLLYANAGPPLIDPAPFELMRGIWEKSLLSAWLLDGGVSSGERLGRIKGWMASGLLRASKGFPSDTQAEVQEMLEECPESKIHPPAWVELSRRRGASGEGVYRELSGLLHGRVWSVAPAFATAWTEGGLVVAWRGYPLSLHRALASSVNECAGMAIESVHAYFVGPPQEP